MAQTRTLQAAPAVLHPLQQLLGLSCTLSLWPAGCACPPATPPHLPGPPAAPGAGPTGPETPPHLDPDARPPRSQGAGSFRAETLPQPSIAQPQPRPHFTLCPGGSLTPQCPLLPSYLAQALSQAQGRRCPLFCLLGLPLAQGHTDPESHSCTGLKPQVRGHIRCQCHLGQVPCHLGQRSGDHGRSQQGSNSVECSHGQGTW